MYQRSYQLPPSPVACGRPPMVYHTWPSPTNKNSIFSQFILFHFSFFHFFKAEIELDCLCGWKRVCWSASEYIFIRFTNLFECLADVEVYQFNQTWKQPQQRFHGLRFRIPDGHEICLRLFCSIGCKKKCFFPPCLSCCPHRLREMPPPMRAKEFVGLLERIIKISFLSVRLAHSNRNCWNRPNYFDLRRPYQQNKQTNTWSDEHILRERARRFQIDRPTDPSHLREKPTGSIWPALERLAFRHARWWNFGSRL